MKTRFSFSIPQTFPSGVVDRELVRKALVKAEQHGFETAWVAEKLFGPLNTLEAVTLLAYAAGITSRIKLGCAVIQTAVRGPMLMAKMLSTIDQLSAGRLIIGVGLGSHPDFLAAQGLPTDKRGERYEEGLELMLKLFTEKKLTFEGKYYKLKDREMEPKPAQKPRPPLIFGALAPVAIARAVRMGDGFIGAGSQAGDGFLGLVKAVHEELGRQKRDPKTFPIAKRVYIGVDKDADRAHKRLREWYGAWYGKPEMADASAVWGSPQQCIEKLKVFTSAGAEEILLNPVYDELEQMDILVSEVMPAFR
jgi:alkanesulfonate monooxygenase SsuD/methylene tetrahydromethanopterin reductase-like flavin-dependent oxidoreductase (luciferase family)